MSLKLAQWIWRRCFKFINVLSQFRNYLPLEKGRALHLNKLESPSPKEAWCQWFWRRRFLKGLYRVWANFGTKKLLSNFLGNSWYKCAIPLEIWHSLKYLHDSDIWRKKSMTFRSLLKIVRKGAYFYLFILFILFIQI